MFRSIVSQQGFPKTQGICSPAHCNSFCNLLTSDWRKKRKLWNSTSHTLALTIAESALNRKSQGQKLHASEHCFVEFAYILCTTWSCRVSILPPQCHVHTLGMLLWRSKASYSARAEMICWAVLHILLCSWVKSCQLSPKCRKILVASSEYGRAG